MTVASFFLFFKSLSSDVNQMIILVAKPAVTYSNYAVLWEIIDCRLDVQSTKFCPSYETVTVVGILVTTS